MAISEADETFLEVVERCDSVLMWNPEGPSCGLLGEFLDFLKKTPVKAFVVFLLMLPVLPMLLPRHVYRKYTTKKFVEKNLPRLKCKMFRGEEMGAKLTKFKDELGRKSYPFNVSTCGGDYPDVLAVLLDPARSMSERDLIKIGMHVINK